MNEFFLYANLRYTVRSNAYENDSPLIKISLPEPLTKKFQLFFSALDTVAISNCGLL